VKNTRLIGSSKPYAYVLFISILLFALQSKVVAQAPVANFSANNTTGCSPLIVQFTDQSTGSPTSWHWDLGNGSTSTIQNPTSTYTTPGTYTIKLIATNASGSNTITKTSYITVFDAPAAKFSSTDTAGCTPHTVTFTDQSTTPSGTITQWEWNFGDGGTSNQKNPSHTYTTSGTFNVFLKVTSSTGCTQTVFKQQHIRVGAGAVADFIANVPNTCQVPVNVTFTNTSQTSGTVTYLWDFGDGGTSTAINPSHSYTTIGTYTVKLSIQSPGGCTSIKQKTFNLSSKEVTFTGPSSVCVGSVATFTQTSSPAPLSQTWNMGDGTTYSTPTVTHTYNGMGTYNVTLTNEFPGGCISTKTQQVEVIGGPSIDFTADTTKACKPPFAVNFQATGATSGLTWDFGDGTTSTQQNPSHTYQTAGTYNVTLSATNATGCVSTVTKSGFITIQPPTLSITNLPINNACTPYSFSPEASINAADGVASYLWDFGNGSTSTDPEAGFTYRVPGTYTIKLRIVTNGGCVDSIVYQDAIKVTQGDSINFFANPVAPCVDQLVQFTPYTTNPPISYTWFFGDKDSSNDMNATHSYSSSAKYNVALLVKYATCMSRLMKEDYIDVKPPEAKFSAVRDCSDKRLIKFTNQSKGTGNMLWNFGDGTTSTLENSAHPYAADGVYTVSLTVDNGTCSHTFTDTLEVSSAAIDFSVSKNTVCKAEPFVFKGAVPNTVNATQYQWTIVNYNVLTSATDSLNTSVHISGVYDVALTVTSSEGCSETVSKPGFLTVYGPTAEFGSDKIGGCLNTTINFSDSSTNDGIHQITQWSWDFGDNSTATTKNASHAYPTFGKYNVALTVTDSYGCTDTRSKANFVNITNGKAMFASDDSLSCRGSNVVFRDTSVGTISFWEWDFGDGNNLNGVQSPAHIYADSGVYTVKLKIIENSGCEDSITKVNYVRIADPRAKFVASDTFSTCPPLTVNFYDQSYYVKTWSWDFDDGGTSPIANPVNLYNIPKNYRVKLTVTSPGGCTDSAFTNIRILGPYGTFDYSPLIGCTPFPVTYNVTSATAVRYLWDYSDGIVDSTTSSTASHTYMSGGRFVPKVILTDAEGCSVPVIGKDTIYIEKTNIDFSASAFSFCDSGTVVFTNNSIIDAPSSRFQWSFGDGASDTSAAPSHQYTTPGWFDVKVTATTPLGCIDTLTKSAYIRVNNSPVASIISQDSLCMPATFNFSAQLQPDTSGIKTWSWTFGNGQTSSVENPPAQIFSTDGSYTNTLFIEDNQGCSTTVSKTVVVHPLPPLQTGNGGTICRGDSIAISATGAATYTWTNSANDLTCTNCPDPTAYPILDKWFYVEGRSQYGCVAYDSVFVRVIQPYKVSVSPVSDSICVGQGITLKALGAPLYSWSPAAGLSSTSIANPIASPQTSTIYTVTGFDSLGCFRDSATVTLKVNDVPTVNAGPDVILSAGSTANLQATTSADVTSFIWSPPTGLSDTRVLNPTVTGGNDITYTIRVSNAAGCTAQDQVKVLVTCTEANIFVPNTFSPNGDGMNDVFYIRGKGIFAIKSLKIFNRWGELVFDKRDVTPNDQSHGWNGMYKGALSSSDTYVYQLEVMCNNSQSLRYNGTISLIR
jgi:gliding motility-associated-like protein